MLFLLWSLPALAVVGLIASGRTGVLAAGAVGACASIAVSLCAAPRGYGPADALVSVARGGWIGLIVVPYIFGGLLFWRIALRGSRDVPAEPITPLTTRSRRYALFTACFLIGPFAESATGFGAGMLGAMAILRPLGFPSTFLRAFALLSQTLILWGAMGSGLIVGAAYAGTTATSLAVSCFPLVALTQFVWLPIFWRLAVRAGAPAANFLELGGEFAWLTTSLAGVFVATVFVGPEVAMLASFGPLIAARWVSAQRPSLNEALHMLRRMSPFAILIIGLVVSRLWPPLTALLQSTGRLQPFASAPAWSPCFHAGSWLVAGAILVGAFRRDAAGMREEAVASWRIGRVAALGVILFSVMAETLAGSGIAGALADGLFSTAGRWALMLTPLLSGVFGLLGNSGNASNSLFMASQVSLAKLASLTVPAVIALQHFSGSMVSMFSPVRMAIICGLAGTPGQERTVYRAMVPHLASLILLLIGFAVLICWRAV
jgi:lactate permease